MSHPLRMNAAHQAVAQEFAQKIKDETVWSKYPNLSEIFENRPARNVYWLEFAALIRERLAQ